LGTTDVVVAVLVVGARVCENIAIIFENIRLTFLFYGALHLKAHPLVRFNDDFTFVYILAYKVVKSE
jgi:hypothetical protein